LIKVELKKLRYSSRFYMVFPDRNMAVTALCDYGQKRRRYHEKRFATSVPAEGITSHPTVVTVAATASNLMRQMSIKPYIPRHRLREFLMKTG